MDDGRAVEREPVAAIVDVPTARPGAAPEAGPASGRRPRRPGSAALAAAGIVAVAAAIVAVGIAGPRPDRAVERPPTPVPSIGAAETPIPLVRRSGDPLADQHVLVSGRWMELAQGRPVGKPTGCERERVMVLASGRIVCVASTVARAPGSKLARYELRAITLGVARVDPLAPPPAGPPPEADAGQDLVTLAGRRDLVVGDPVAIAIAPGRGDDLYLAWAAREADGYRVVLDRFRLGPGGRSVGGETAAAVTAGRWELGRVPGSGGDAVDTLGDLAVSAAPDGARILVGWTVAGPGVAGQARRLVLVRPDQPDPPAALPADATLGLALDAADGPSRAGTPCGGAWGEGFATDRTVFVVCPGAPAELRRIDVGDPGRAAAGFGAISAVTSLAPATGRAGRPLDESAWLAGNGVAIDRASARYYRWSPWARTLLVVDLAADSTTGGQRDAVSIAIRTPDEPTPATPAPGGPPRDAGEAVGPGPRPILALDEAGGRLFLLGTPPPIAAATGAPGPAIFVVDAAGLRPIARWAIAESGARSITLSPDRRYLYLATAPRPAGGAPLTVGLAVHDASAGGEVAYAGRLRVAAGGSVAAVVVR